MNVCLHVGCSGSGKTYALQRAVWRDVQRDTMRVIVLDRMHEWVRVPQGVTAARHATVEGALLDVTHSVLVVSASREDIRDTAQRAADWALRGKDLRGVIIPEAYRAAPSQGRLAPEIEEIACAGRHHAARLYLDVQRPTMLHPTLREQSEIWRAFAAYSQDDLSLYRAIGGSDLADGVRECGARLTAGQPGWHIELDAARRPPFSLRRAK